MKTRPTATAVALRARRVHAAVLARRRGGGVRPTLLAAVAFTGGALGMAASAAFRTAGDDRPVDVDAPPLAMAVAEMPAVTPWAPAMAGSTPPITGSATIPERPASLGEEGVAAEESDDELIRAAATPDSGGTSSAAVGDLRWFNGRPVRPVRTITMVVTAYSPDARSCGVHADGITASGYSVRTNGMKLVAADTSILPFGSLLTVPGYDWGDVVPVLDRGGAIKGHRLDVLFPTHEAALEWGVRELDVTVWEYADGEPDDFREDHAW